MTDMSIEPNSEQVNAEDFLGGPMEVTITGHNRGTAEQPVFIDLAEFPGRTYRPGKTMRRMMVAAWGPNPANYAGRRMTLYNDPEVRFGKSAVGGIRISAMSHIDGPVTANLMVSRGKRAPFTVQPLKATEPVYTVDDAAGWLQAATSMPELQQAWGSVQQVGMASDAGLVELKDARKGELTGG